MTDPHLARNCLFNQAVVVDGDTSKGCLGEEARPLIALLVVQVCDDGPADEFALDQIVEFSGRPQTQKAGLL